MTEDDTDARDATPEEETMIAEIARLSRVVGELMWALQTISAEAKEPYSGGSARSVSKALSTCGEVADLALKNTALRALAGQPPV